MELRTGVPSGKHSHAACYRQGKWMASYLVDVVAAFLNTPCDRDVFVKPAPGDEERDATTGETTTRVSLSYI